MKPRRAFAIVDSDGKLACWNAQVPIYWLRKIAVRECNDHFLADSKVVTVEVRAAPKRTPTKKDSAK